MSQFLNALKGKCSGPTPAWLMRQAGRYLPEYRELRKKHNFLEMCHSPELATEITLMPIRRFGFDAAILFSDILVVPEAMGKPFVFLEGKGPVLENPVRSVSDIKMLQHPDVSESLNFVTQAIVELKKNLDVPLIGFCGAPYTIASYLVEGQSSRDWRETKKLLFHYPEVFQALLQTITDVTKEYITLQIESGVDAIQIFDSWVGSLAYPQFKMFAKPCIKELVEHVKSHDIPVILFAKGGMPFLDDLVEIKPNALSLDWTCPLAKIRKNLDPLIALQGNLDPQVLFAPQKIVEKQCRALIDSMSGNGGYIFNLGHGILPQTPLESVETLLKTIRG